MVNLGEKAKINKAGNLNYGRSYVITTLQIPLSKWELQMRNPLD